MREPDLHFSILGSHFAITGTTGHLRELVAQNFAAYRSTATDKPAFFALRSLPEGRCALESSRSGVIWETGADGDDTADDYRFLYAVEKELTLELQRARHDLYFVHAAVMERNGRCMLIAAESAAGKSTTAFALQGRGFRYMSDELAPIDIANASVLPYRHALCLKSVPPEPFARLPPHIATGRTRHIPAGRLNAVDSDAAVPLGALIFLRRIGTAELPRLNEVSPAEAAARLYANTLNALAHPNAGLDAAASVAHRVPAWRLDAGNLAHTCQLLESLRF